MDLLTSGTTGMPKLVVHSLESLAGALPRQPPRPAHGLEHVLRHPPLWRTADLFARRAFRLAAGALERRRIDREFLARAGARA